MSKRKIERRPLKKISIGDMRTPVGIYHASLVTSNGVDPVRKLDAVIEPWFCSVETINGEIMFGESNIEEAVTHVFKGRYLESITVDHMVAYDGRLFRIINTNNYEARDEYLELVCSERGSSNLRVNHG